MRDILIRNAQADDLPIIQRIARRTIDKSYRSFLGDDGVDGFINSGESNKELEKHLEHCDVLLHDGDIAAFTICFDDLIHLMMVDFVLHRSGIGSELLAHAENKLFANGNSTIRLETFEGNQQAINFYKKKGWSAVKKEVDKKHGFIRVYFEKNA